MDAELPRDWLRGALEPCLLGPLAAGEAYGYELAARLEEAGVGTVAGGSLYLALLRQLAGQWATFATAVGRVLRAGAARPGASRPGGFAARTVAMSPESWLEASTA